MSSTHTNLLFHIVFSTKYRRNTIHESDRLYEYLGGIIRESKGTLVEIGGMPDHVHILARLSPTIAISDVLRTVKTNSSKWLNETFQSSIPFAWQRGFGWLIDGRRTWGRRTWGSRTWGSRTWGSRPRLYAVAAPRLVDGWPAYLRLAYLGLAPPSTWARQITGPLARTQTPSTRRWVPLAPSRHMKHLKMGDVLAHRLFGGAEAAGGSTAEAEGKT